MAFKSALLRFLSELDSVGASHAEIYDSNVREQLWESLHYYVIHRQENGRRPVVYGMLTKEADDGVAAAVNTFIEGARNDKRFAVMTAEERMQELHDDAQETEGGSSYGDYLGYSLSADAVRDIEESRFAEPDYSQLQPVEGIPAKPRYNIKVLYVSMAIALAIIALIIVMVIVMSQSGETPRG